MEFPNSEPLILIDSASLFAGASLLAPETMHCRRLGWRENCSQPPIAKPRTNHSLPFLIQVMLLVFDLIGFFVGFFVGALVTLVLAAQIRIRTQKGRE